ncbi:MAG TPA: DUF1735 domain-containing protein [Chitinophaga sp.]|uniref:BT_3987 domain-containing protein n=1 Tax=Chitinophaga sp. TaxID=1869181 RepID=UPI002B7A99AF|nr:DUF1735 domain-containing protein [Chitinophaga sp.]HVI43933.1 DUF1735 domain-containing protein [Chitinophaga sp.]
MRYTYYLIVLLLCWGCNKVPDHSNKVYFTQATGSPVLPLTLDNGAGKIDLTVSTTYTVPGDVSVSILVDSSYLAAYNEANHTTYEAVPASAMTLSASAVTVKGGSASGSNVITVTVKEWPGFDNSKQYTVPLKIASTSNGMGGIPGSDIALVRVIKVINSDAPQLNIFDTPYTDGSYTVVSTAPTYTYNPGSQITIEGRFKYTGNTSGFTNWFGCIFSGAGFFFVINQGTSDLRIHVGSLQFSAIGQAAPGVWHHFAIVSDRGNCLVYLDEKKLLNTTISGDNTFGAGAGSVGSHAGTVNMAFAEYRIWKTARTPRELASNVCAANPKDPDLIAYWPMDKANTDQTGAAHQTRDVTGRGYDMKLNPAVGRINLTWIPVKCPE